MQSSPSMKCGNLSHKSNKFDAIFLDFHLMMKKPTLRRTLTQKNYCLRPKMSGREKCRVDEILILKGSYRISNEILPKTSWMANFLSPLKLKWLGQVFSLPLNIRKIQLLWLNFVKAGFSADLSVLHREDKLTLALRNYF